MRDLSCIIFLKYFLILLRKGGGNSDSAFNTLALKFARQFIRFVYILVKIICICAASAAAIELCKAVRACGFCINI